MISLWRCPCFVCFAIKAWYCLFVLGKSTLFSFIVFRGSESEDEIVETENELY
jgi:hypothetical protein